MVNFRLDGRTALVTGASRGLGRAIADGLRELGATVHGTSRDTTAAADIARRYGTRPLVLDVASLGSIHALGDWLLSDGRSVDLLVNNAGVNTPQPALDVDSESWDAVYRTNVRGLFLVSQAMARHWVANGTRGAIVNIGSQAGAVAIEDRAAYGSSKAAVAQLTRNLAFEWAAYGIRVNNVAPAFVRTELTATTLAHGAWADELRSRIPLGRFGETDEVVGAVAFLLGPTASLVTGHTLFIDGGYTIR